MHAGFRSCGTRASGVVAHGLQELWHAGLVAPWHVRSSRTRDRTHVPCVGRWMLNHCAIREVPVFVFVFVFLMIVSTFYIGFMTFLNWVQTLLQHLHLAQPPPDKVKEHTRAIHQVCTPSTGLSSGYDYYLVVGHNVHSEISQTRKMPVEKTGGPAQHCQLEELVKQKVGRT